MNELLKPYLNKNCGGPEYLLASFCMFCNMGFVLLCLVFNLGRPPGPEMEYCTDRESYSLAAGLALGMVCLGVSSPLVSIHVSFYFLLN